MSAGLDLRTTAQAWLTQGRRAIVVVVDAHRGSVPRETGTRMLVSADEVAGTIGGGHLELKAIADARGLLQRAQALPSPSTTQTIALGPSLGQCCGGSLDLRFTALTSAEWAAWPTTAPLFTLQLYGAGHVGRAIARLLASIHCRVQWIDERDAEFPQDPGPDHIQRVCVEPVEAEVAVAPPGACYLVLTHSHDLDLAISQAVLARGDFSYFGLIGSATKRARFEHRLLQRGLPPTRVQRMVCPIGVSGISGKEPEVIAVAVVAQLLQAAGQANSAVV